MNSPWDTQLPFVELLRKTRADAVGQSHVYAPNASGERLPWTEQLRQSRSEARAQSADPWRIRLERVRSKADSDGVERISTQDLFDLLELPQRSRTAGACRRLATIMRELGWSPIKARGLTQGGFRDQVRGYARETGSSAAT